MLTYRNSAEADADRSQQFELLRAIGGQDRALRRDECGAWTIRGKYGRIYTWGDVGRTSWSLCVICPTNRAWAGAKRRLSFCAVTQDCDTEGVLRLTAAPTAAQAKELRAVLGLRKRREYDPAALQRLRASAGRAFAASRGAPIQGGAASLPQPPLEYEKNPQPASFDTARESC